jgi:molybdopterin biosynthesis enzyme
MAVFRVDGLPGAPLAAAARFHAEMLPQVIAAIEPRPDHLALVFGPADYMHRDWRRAVVRQLARDHAPVRINALASDDEKGIVAALAYLERASGVTGQYLSLDGEGAAALLSQDR